MLKKLLHGFVFGLGFSIAVLLVTWAVSTYQFSSFNNGRVALPSEDGISYEDSEKWRELPTSEKITKLSGVALLRFKEGDDMFMGAYVESIYPKISTVQLPVSVGDRVESSDYYAKEGLGRNRDGILLMYVGNPPKEIEGAYLYDSRLVAHGDMPLEVFLKRLEKSWGK